MNERRRSAEKKVTNDATRTERRTDVLVVWPATGNAAADRRRLPTADLGVRSVQAPPLGRLPIGRPPHYVRLWLGAAANQRRAPPPWPGPLSRRPAGGGRTPGEQKKSTKKKKRKEKKSRNNEETMATTSQRRRRHRRRTPLILKLDRSQKGLLGRW